MSLRVRPLAVLVAVVACLVLARSAGAQPLGGPQNPWRGCCGVSAWPRGHSLLGPYNGQPLGAWPDTARNVVARLGGAPAQYADLKNPSPRTRATLDRGAEVYAANCASCHGGTGWGDGPAAQKLSPPPADLAWLWRMPASRWDGFMYWTVAEGGAPLGSTMPSFKQSLTKDDIWSVIAYIQARLPPAPR